MSDNTANTIRRFGHPIIILIDIVSILIGFYGLHNARPQLPDNLKQAGHWQFLTNISLLASIITFTIGLFSHLTRSVRLFELKNILHTITFVAEAVVTSVYWPLRLFFLHYLIHDRSITIKLVVDLSIHLMPFISLAIDFFFFSPNFQIKTTTAVVLFLGLTSSYWLWLNYLIDFENGGVFPYAFLNIGTSFTRAIIFWGIGFSAFLQFLLMRFIYTLFVKPQVEKDKKE